MAIADLKAQIARLPEQPGVYLYYNGTGETLYVGKARTLRDRVRSYLGAHGMSPRIDALLDEAERLEVIVTDSVVEALALENHLIKQRGPKYNILLRDDKNYPYLQLTTGEAFPRVLVARRVERDEHVYAGPFLPASLARRTMSLTHRLFGMRSCNEVITGERPRPCLEYDIKRCVAPCVREICSPEAYGVAVDHTRLFLEGRNDELLAGLRRRMADASDHERFEEAAQVRDAIRTIETLRTRQQKMASPGLGDRDAFGIKLGPAGAVVQIFEVRGGRVVERIELISESGGEASGGRPVRDASDAEVLQAALQQFYADRVAPPEVHLPVAFAEADTEMLEGWLSAQASRRVRLVVPRRGEKRGLLDLAARNAELAYQSRFNENVAAHFDALETLRSVLALPGVPRRIECFDISTIQGSETVASMVVCEDGRMKRSEYRKFRIRGAAPRSRPLALTVGSEDGGQTPAPAAAPRSESARRAALSQSRPLALTVDSEDGDRPPAPAAAPRSESASRTDLPKSPPMALTVDSEDGGQTPAPAAAPRSESASRTDLPKSPPMALTVDSEDGGQTPAPAAAPRSESASAAGAAGGGGAPPALNNDFAAMYEVVLRRYRRVLEGGGPFPDLILIDGGKGQLGAAYDALEALGLGNLVAVGIAKKEELLFTRERPDAIALARDGAPLLLIQRIRDEAHRFAVTFHRQARSSRDLRSELDGIAGVGPRRRKALLTTFGSLAGVRRATREELARVVGRKAADAVLGHFAGLAGGSVGRR